MNEPSDLKYKFVFGCNAVSPEDAKKFVLLMMRAAHSLIEEACPNITDCALDDVGHNFHAWMGLNPKGSFGEWPFGNLEPQVTVNVTFSDE